MSRANPLRQCRHPTTQSWVGALLVALLLLAEAFAVTHSYDSAAHANGQPCAVCLGAAAFSAGAVGAPVQADVAVATPIVAAAAVVVFFAAVPARRFARGPPIVSFML
jgi:hypothetical protein